jgi:hypothetical protein
MSQVVKKTLKPFKGKVYDISTPSGNFQLENGQVVSNSAGGSLLSYCLGITQIDPLKYDLLFERFLTRGATSYPDIDVDFTDNFALKQKLAQLWGEESVIAISNINTLKFRSLIKDVSKFFGVPFDEVNAITKIMLDEAIPKAKAKHEITAGVYDPTYEELIEFSPSLQQFLKKYPDVAENIKTLQGQIKAISRHASGVLVSDNLFSKMPVISSSGVRQTPWGEGQTVRHLEPLGFIKFDILGLSTLQIIRGAITRVLRLEVGREPTLQEVSKFYDEKLHPDKINLKDQKVFENVFQQGNWAATFQFAERGAQEFCMKVKPKSIEEITAITSIYRPGAMCLSGKTDIICSVGYLKGGDRPSFRREKIEDLWVKKQNSNFHLHPRYVVSVDEKTGKFFRNKIVDVYKSGIKPVYKLLYQSSLTQKNNIVDSSNESTQYQQKIEATLEHRFYTQNGWKMLKDLEDGDYLCVPLKRIIASSKIKDKRGEKAQFLCGRKNFRNICFRTYQYKCLFCDWKEGSLDVNHIDGNRNTNNEAENLCFLCPNHHRLYSEKKISREKLLEKNKEMLLPFSDSDDVYFVKFLGKQFVREEETYDIEVEGPNHNFFAGDLLVHNSSNVHYDYVSAKANPENIKYLHPILKELLEKNYGFILYQEDLANISHRLGKDISLEEGNLLRKLLIKKGLGEVGGKKQVIHDKFLQGCLEKGIAEEDAEDLWGKMESFSQYSFNKCLHEDTNVETKTGIKKIKDVKIGDEVNSVNGFVKVLDKMNNGTKKLYKITTSSGKTLCCTLDHKLETNEGMLPLEEIIKRKLKIITKPVILKKDLPEKIGMIGEIIVSNDIFYDENSGKSGWINKEIDDRLATNNGNPYLRKEALVSQFFTIEKQSKNGKIGCGGENIGKVVAFRLSGYTSNSISLDRNVPSLIEKGKYCIECGNQEISKLQKDHKIGLHFQDGDERVEKQESYTTRCNSCNNIKRERCKKCSIYNKYERNICPLDENPCAGCPLHDRTGEDWRKRLNEIKN